MSDNELISVIVPIFKVEDYLRKCVDSVINQTYKNLEIILVDDGSPDNCPKICDEYANQDSRIKVIHKENGGLSDARNAGMKIAKGEYVSFIDSDDYISCDCIETLYYTMKAENSDIVECDIVRFEDGTTPVIEKENCDINSFSTEKGLSMLMAESKFHQYVWNKLYKSDIAFKIPFAKGKLNEDEFWTYQIFGQAERVTKINKPMYFYLQRSGSIMGEGFNLRRLDALEAKAERQKYIEANFPNLEKQAKTDLFATCIFMCQSAMKFLKGKEKKQAKNVIKKYVDKNRLDKEDLTLISEKSRMWFKFANKCFYLCCKIRSITGVGF